MLGSHGDIKNLQKKLVSSDTADKSLQKDAELYRRGRVKAFPAITAPHGQGLSRGGGRES